MRKLEQMLHPLRKGSEMEPPKEMQREPIIAIATAMTKTVQAREVFELDDKETIQFAEFLAHPLVDLTLHPEKYSQYMYPHNIRSHTPLIASTKQDKLQNKYPNPLFFPSKLPYDIINHKRALLNAARGTFLQSLDFLRDQTSQIRQERDQDQFDLVAELRQDMRRRIANDIRIEPAVPYAIRDVVLPQVQLTEFLQKDKEAIHHFRRYAIRF